MPARRHRLARSIRVLVLAAALARCSSAADAAREGDIATGTWGGENAGMLVSDTLAHVHIGCTYGDFPAPIALDADGRFTVSGSYLLRAFPIAIGPTMPAQFAGVLRGRTLTITVAVNDTIEKKLVVLGPADITFDREPRMQVCPICSMPGM